MFGRKPEPPARPGITSFKFDKSGWTVARSETGEVLRVNELGDLMLQRFKVEVPTGLPPNWRDVHALRAAMAAKPALAKAAVVSVGVVSLPCGVTAAQYVTKERMAAPSLGHRYVGMLTMPFADFFHNLWFIAEEGDPTGYREAALVASGKVTMPEPEGPIPVIESEEQLEAMYAAAREQPPVRTSCDDERWDDAFPTHPLSRVRGYLRRVRDGMTVDDAARAARPFGG
jgi:hypothetical protein